MTDKTTQALRSPDYLRRYFEATGRKYVTGRNVKCPNAGAHKQGDANPSAKIYEDANGAHVKCFGCGFQGDIFALWQLDNGGTFKEAKAALCAMFGIEQGKGRTSGAVRSARTGDKENIAVYVFRHPLPNYIDKIRLANAAKQIVIIENGKLKIVKG